MDKIKCANTSCDNKVDALSMDDDGCCDECHNKLIDGMIVEESDETRFLSDESLRIMCEHPIRVNRVRSSRPSTNFRKNQCR